VPVLWGRGHARRRRSPANEMIDPSALSEESESATSLARFESEWVRAGRNGGPQLLWEWWDFGELLRDDFVRLLPEVWRLAEWPARSLGQRAWLAMFTAAGFVSDCGSAPPTEPLVVYRGATFKNMRGMSWTTDLDRARWFANRERLFHGGEGEVFMVPAPPHAVLAHIVGRGEAEVVLNPCCLRGRAEPKLRRTGTIANASSTG